MAMQYEPKIERIEIRAPCRPEFVRMIRRAVADFAESSNVPRSQIAEIEVAASEAVTNIVRHAYPDSDSSGYPVRVKCSHGRTGFTVEISDKGCGFRVPSGDAIPEVDLDRDGGYGIVIIKALMDSVDVKSEPKKGTRIRMTKTARRALRQAARQSAPIVGA